MIVKVDSKDIIKVLMCHAGSLKTRYINGKDVIVNHPVALCVSRVEHLYCGKHHFVDRIKVEDTGVRGAQHWVIVPIDCIKGFDVYVTNRMGRAHPRMRILTETKSGRTDHITVYRQGAFTLSPSGDVENQIGEFIKRNPGAFHDS